MGKTTSSCVLSRTAWRPKIARFLREFQLNARNTPPRAAHSSKFKNSFAVALELLLREPIRDLREGIETVS